MLKIDQTSLFVFVFEASPYDARQYITEIYSPRNLVEMVCQRAVKHTSFKKWLFCTIFAQGNLFFCGVKVHDLTSVCVSTSICDWSQTDKQDFSALSYQRPACLPPSVFVPACICCFTVVSNILIAIKINCFQLGINQVELKQDVCLSACLPQPASPAVR